jgi:hypothetical protein
VAQHVRANGKEAFSDNPHIPESLRLATMINETIILLIHYYSPEDYGHVLLRGILKKHCGIHLPFNLYLCEPLQRIFSNVIVCDYLKRRAEIGIRAVNEEVYGPG